MKYQTLDELMTGKQPGEVKVTESQLYPAYWIIPYFKNKEGNWCGLDSNGDAITGLYPDKPFWTIYTPPKKTVTKWLWACLDNTSRTVGWELDKKFMTAAEAAEWFSYGSGKFEYIKTNVSITVEEGD